MYHRAREARYRGAKLALEIRGAAASETQMFAGCLIPWATSQARGKKVGSNRPGAVIRDKRSAIRHEVVRR